MILCVFEALCENKSRAILVENKQIYTEDAR